MCNFMSRNMVKWIALLTVIAFVLTIFAGIILSFFLK
jgi:hypothetical protein